MNIDHGDSSRSATVVDFNGLLPLSAGVAVASDAKDGATAAGADGATADGLCRDRRRNRNRRRGSLLRRRSHLRLRR
jgi:hypothetical protein